MQRVSRRTAGCSDAEPVHPLIDAGTGGTGGSTSPPGPCPDVRLDFDAGMLPATPDADDIAVCQGLAARLVKCHPHCPTQPVDQCADVMACDRAILRPDMIADLYACLPTLQCSDGDDGLVNLCATSLAGKYPPSSAQTAYETTLAAFEAQCSPPAASALCGGAPCFGFTDSMYQGLRQCMSPGGSCADAWFCMASTVALADLNCSYPPDGGPIVEGDGG